MRQAALYAWVALSVAAPAHAYTVRVVAATELRLEPSVAPDGGLTVVIHLRNDQRAPVRQRAVTLQVEGVSSAVVTDDHGDGETTLRARPGALVVQVDAGYAGDRTTAPATASIRVNLAAPFVTADLEVPPVVELDTLEARIPAVVTVRTGQSRLLSSLRMSVDVTADERQIAAGQTDASGRAAFMVPARAFGPVGVHRLRPHVSVLSDTLAGTERNIIVRARTALTLARVPGSDGVVLAGGLATRAGPVPGAAIRVVRGDRTLAGARTDARGAFVCRLGSEILGEPDTAVQAVFEPTEPWWVGSRSPSLELAAPPAPRIHWIWEALPLVVAAMVLGVAVARGRGGRPAATEVKPADPASDLPEVRHLAGGRVGGLRVRVVVVDRSTGASVAEAHVRWRRNGEWQPVQADALELPPARRMDLEVGAPGFAPQGVRADFPRPGEYVVRVALRTWREELFGRARAWLQWGAAGATAVTPREALSRERESAEETRAFVDLVEAGCYGPEAPGAREVAHADGLLAVIRSAPKAPPPRGER